MAVRPSYDCTVWFQGPEGQQCAIVLHYVGAPPSDQDAMEETANDLATLWSGVAKPVITTECKYLRVSLRFVSPALSFDAENTSGNGFGTVTGDTLPAETAAIMRKRGTGPAKRARGTTFWPCVPEAYSDGSVVNTVGVAAYAPVLEALAAPVNGSGVALVPVVMSRKADQNYTLLSASLGPVLGHQRRRRPE